MIANWEGEYESNGNIIHIHGSKRSYVAHTKNLFGYDCRKRIAYDDIDESEANRGFVGIDFLIQLRYFFATNFKN
jgi:hypothetical protein